MPIFEYKCEACEKVFDILTKSQNKDEKVECPHCQSTEVKKLFSSFGIGAASCSGKEKGSCGQCCGMHH